MSNYTYQMTKTGEILPYEPPVPWSDGESDDAYFSRLGFKGGPEHSIGDEDLEHRSWHERTEGDGHQYLATWNDVNRCRLIFVPDWPMLLKLQALVAPIIQAVTFQYRLGEVQKMAEKAFRVLHDHDPRDCCRQCDPDEIKRIEQHRAIRAQAKADKSENE